MSETITFSFPGSAWERATARLCLAARSQPLGGKRFSLLVGVGSGSSTSFFPQPANGPSKQSDPHNNSQSRRRIEKSPLTGLLIIAHHLAAGARGQGRQDGVGGAIAQEM